MNRRGFFSKLLGGAAVVAVMPLLPMPAPRLNAEAQLSKMLTDHINDDIRSIMIADMRRLNARIAKAITANSPFINVIQGGKFPNTL